MADPTGITPTSPAIGPSSPPITSAPVGDAMPAHQPYVPDSSAIPEFTWPAVVVGALLGIVFGASSLYLVLKVGLTVSASIPVAVLSITLFRAFSKAFGVRSATILENNIVQTTGSAGESIAFGVGVTMPALMLLGFEMNVGRVLVVAILGGLLGILMMIPLRRAFIVKQHGTLKYPEGTACADVLIAGEKGGSTALAVFVGFGVAFVYQFLRGGFKLFKDAPEKTLKFFKGATPAIDVDPTLLGVGYIIGTRISAVMAAGGVMAAMVLTPAIAYFGDKLPSSLGTAENRISEMDYDAIRDSYVLYIGAGAVAAGGIISVFQALPLIVSSIAAGIRDLRATRRGEGSGARTDRDMPLSTVGVGSLVLVAAIWATTPLHREFSWIPDLHMNVLGACLIVLFGFLFVTVSSRLTGEIGSSSNPISGMTVATLLLTCLIFVAIKWTRPDDRLTALSIAAVVCIAASNGGTTSQDLKTGYLVGATPKWQQWAIVAGALSSALVIGIILIRLNDAYTIYTQKNLPTPEEPVEMSKLTEKTKAPDDDAEYWVWRAPEGNKEGVKPGQYLVDDAGQIRYLVDPGINGQRKQRDDGTEVVRFNAPKARLMALITDGVLSENLPWDLVLIGVFIAIVLELCSIPSLAFAVGVYLPMSSSTPILAGGLVRWCVERTRRRPTPASGVPADAAPPADEDTSPGALLSTGYIAGGAIAGVLIAFLSFSEEIPKQLAAWQYRTWTNDKDQPLKDAVKKIAKERLGITEEPPEEDKKTQERLDEDMGEISGINKELVPRFWPVPKGFELKLPKSLTYTTEEATTLGKVAADKLGSETKAQALLTLNIDQLIIVPKGTTLELPRKPNFRGEENVTAVWDPKDKRFVVTPKTVKVEEGGTLGAVAKQLLGKEERAQELYELERRKTTAPNHDSEGHTAEIAPGDLAGSRSVRSADRLPVPGRYRDAAPRPELAQQRRSTVFIRVDSTRREARPALPFGSRRTNSLLSSLLDVTDDSIASSPGVSCMRLPLCRLWIRLEQAGGPER